jgi:hypothetical protein
MRWEATLSIYRYQIYQMHDIQWLTLDYRFKTPDYGSKLCACVFKTLDYRFKTPDYDSEIWACV